MDSALSLFCLLLRVLKTDGVVGVLEARVRVLCSVGGKRGRELHAAVQVYARHSPAGQHHAAGHLGIVRCMCIAARWRFFERRFLGTVWLCAALPDSHCDMRAVLPVPQMSRRWTTCSSAMW